MTLRRTLFLILICLIGRAGLDAQSQITSPLSTVEPTAISQGDPEEAFLSPARYTNAYFGFEFEFPPEARLKPVPMPAALDRRIQLLEMAGPTPQHAAISISAYEYKGKNWTDAKGILRRQLDQDLYTGVEELHGLSKTVIDGHQFYYFEIRRGVEQHVALATELNDYVLVAVLQANDPKMVKDLTSAFSRLKFFPPREAESNAGSVAAPYQGPAVSSQRLRQLKTHPPAESMDRGSVDGSVYRNAQIGLTYEFPSGWSVQPRGAVEPAVERYREKVTGEPAMGPRERDVVKACRRTLFSAWKTKPDDDGQVPYDDFGEVTLSAMPLSCFPNIHFPDDSHDAEAVRRFLQGVSFSQPLQRDMTDARTFQAGGKTYVLTRGSIAYKEEGDSLSRRISVALALTQHRGYLLVWFFAAPHEAELRELMNAKVGFDLETETREAKSSVAGSPEKTPAPGGSAPSEAASAASTSAVPSPAPESPVVKGQSEVNPALTGNPMTSRPTLLKPGETTEDGQTQGKPVPKKESQ